MLTMVVIMIMIMSMTVIVVAVREQLFSIMKVESETVLLDEHVTFRQIDLVDNSIVPLPSVRVHPNILTPCKNAGDRHQETCDR